LTLRVRNILMPVDLQRSQALAVEWSGAFARCFGATVELLSVRSTPALDDEADHGSMRDGRHETLDDLRDRLRTAGVGVENAPAGGDAAFERILRRTESGGCDLVVMSAESRNKRMSVTAPSLTASVRRHASIPVLSMRAPGSELAATLRGRGSEIADRELPIPASPVSIGGYAFAGHG
jgi:nucleotide-binding universal stress UspA family protein